MVFWYFSTMLGWLFGRGWLAKLCATKTILHEGAVPGKGIVRKFHYAKRPPRKRLSCVLGILSSLEVQVLRPT